MKAMKIITVICWLVVAAVLLGFAGWFLTGTVFGTRTDRWYNNISFGVGVNHLETLTGPYEMVGTHRFEVSDISSINVDWIAGNITVKPHDGSQITVTEFAQRELRENEKFQTSVSAGTLTVRFRERGNTGPMPQKKLEILIPLELSGNLSRLSVDSVSGSISVENIEAAYLSVDSISGAVDFSNSTARSLKVNTTSGAITVKTVQSDNMEFDSISGAIRVSDSFARVIDCDSTSGRIDVYGGYGKAKLNSLSGKITLDNSEQSSVVDADSTSGTLELSGSFETVNANTLSGSISIKSTMIPSSLKVDSTSGSVTIAVPNEGSITVYHSSTSGRFSSDIPVSMQNRRGAQFEISTLSGRTTITALP